MSNVKVKNISVRYPFRNLKNYKRLHEETAKKKGVYEEFMGAKTLTVAKKVLFK